MHNYPLNSPEAAARLLALAMIADGNVCRSELDAVRRIGIEEELGLAPGALAAALQTLCEDLLCSQPCGALGSCLDDALLEALIRDVDDAELQRKVMAAVAATAAADGYLADGEQHLLSALQRCWRPHPHVPACAMADRNARLA
jgi:hypothetical protein